jgi:hypothetical protein
LLSFLPSSLMLMLMLMVILFCSQEHRGRRHEQE